MRGNFLIIFIFSGFCALGQSLVIQGKVLDTDLEGLPGIYIYDQDTTLLTTSDLKGNFQLTLSEPTRLLFGGVGMEWENIMVSKNCTNIEVIMIIDVLYHYKSHRKIDRLRKRDFDNRIKLHKKASEQGIFVLTTPCFNYDFIPNKPELDEIRAWKKKKHIEIREEFNQLTLGDTIYVPYSGPNTGSVHSAYSDYTNYDCIITGTVLRKDKKRRGFNIQYKVIDMNNCIYESLKHKEKVVNVGDTIEYNMKYFRLITISNIR